MYSELDDYQVDAKGLDASRSKMQESTPPSGRREIASPPQVDASDDSFPLSDLSNSPSPTAGRRMSLLSDASVGASGPLTPNKRLFEDIVVNEVSNRAVEYQRIHSTPYPKARLPTQLTPHPQARIVSLPEYSRNRNPFLESLRNPRSVSSPVRLKPAPLSPIYHEAEEDVESSLEISGHSSASVLPPPHFPVLGDSYQRSPEASQLYQLDPSYASSEHLYTAPRGLYFTPPSFQSLALSPLTTGPERSLPMDRPLVASQDRVSVDQDSEGEVSIMLHQMTLDASYRPARSSVAASTTSRVSSPESSVVFLSPMTKIPRAFLGARRTTSGSTHRSTPSLDPIPQEPDSVAHRHDNPDDLHSKRHSLSERLGFARPEKEDGYPNTRQKSVPGVPNPIPSRTFARPAIDIATEHDWILFDEPPKPIPALHGPPSLPYARCPSGAEGVILDGSQPVDDLVWGLSEDSAPRSHPAHTPGYYDAEAAGANHQPLSYGCRVDKRSTGINTQDANAAVVSRSRDRPDSSQREIPSIVGTVGHSIVPSVAKEKHVRFLDTATNKAATRATTESVHNVVPQLHGSSAASGATRPGTSRSATENLALLLQEQLQRAHMTEHRAPERTKVPTPQETLDQLRRFGVPFRPRVAPPVAATEPLAPNTRFQFVTRSTSLADLLASQSHEHALQEQAPSVRYHQQIPRFGSDTVGASASVSHPLQSRSTEPWHAGGSRSLSNATSIPLLRLRQRQYEESQPPRARDPSTEETLSGYPRSSRSGGDVPSQKQISSELRSPLKSSQPASIRASSKNEDPTVSPLANHVGSSGPSGHSPNRRRPRKGGKRVPPSNSAGQSGSPQKENDHAPKESGATPRKSAPRQTSRKKGNQRSRADSLPQSASRSG